MTVPQLDLSQQAAAHVAAGERQVVVAGPGSGKTEVVSALVEHLVVEEDLDPQYSLVVLSFSRAAVHAVTRRLHAGGVQAVAAVRTLDSLATSIVQEAYGEEISGRDVFDRRIARAIQALEAGAWEAVEELEHVIVDEVQDVVGLRAEFLMTLLDSLPPTAGFTLLGDAAQAIYDFQLSPEHPTTSGELLEHVLASPGVVRRELTGSYRAGTRDASAAVALRSAGDASLRGAEGEIEDFVLEMTTVDDEGIAELARRQGGKLVVLTRTNGQALMEAQDLYRAGVPVQVRRSAASPVVAPWVANILGCAPTWTLEDLVSAIGDEQVAVERWRALRAWIPGGSRTLETREVARRLRRGVVPGELLAADPDVPVVSTVHRAKGLEFDTVVYADYDTVDEDATRAARAAYVAVTRARHRLLRIERSRYPHILVRHSTTGRWCRAWTQPYRRKAVEVRGDDVDRTTPPGEDVAAAQRHLRERVRVGDPVDLVHDWTSGDVPYWWVRHEGVVVGRTSTSFGADASRLLPGNLRTDLLGVHVECVETVVGDPTEGPEGIGRHGLWLGVRLAGLAVRQWKDKE